MLRFLDNCVLVVLQIHGMFVVFALRADSGMLRRTQREHAVRLAHWLHFELPESKAAVQLGLYFALVLPCYVIQSLYGRFVAFLLLQKHKTQGIDQIARVI